MPGITSFCLFFFKLWLKPQTVGRVKPPSSKTQAQHSCTLLTLQICSRCISQDLAHILRMLPAPPWPLFLSWGRGSTSCGGLKRTHTVTEVAGHDHCSSCSPGRTGNGWAVPNHHCSSHTRAHSLPTFYSGINLQQIQSKFSLLEMSLPNLANLSKGSKAL